MLVLSIYVLIEMSVEILIEIPEHELVILDHIDLAICLVFLFVRNKNDIIILQIINGFCSIIVLLILYQILDSGK